MTRAIVNAFATTLPGATVSDPWGGGHDAWKVGGKMFACVGAMADHGVAVKCLDIDTAALLVEMGRALRAPYFHASWVRLPWGLVPDAELRERIATSYRLIRAGLPKKVSAPQIRIDAHALGTDDGLFGIASVVELSTNIQATASCRRNVMIQFATWCCVRWAAPRYVMVGN